MKIIFIKPKTDLHVIIPPINFIYLAGHLKKHTLKLIDGHLNNLSDEQIIKQAEEFNPDVVCFGGLSSEIDYSLNLAKKVRKLIKAKIIFGGVHVTNFSKEILSKDYIDFIFKAESEIPFAEFIDKLEKGGSDCLKVSNLGYKKDGKMFFNEVKLYDFNKINLPNWNLIELKKYLKTFINKRSPCAPIFTSRGCPFSCTFCSSYSMNGRGFREKNLDTVIKELKYLKQRFGIREFHIWDENFTLKKERAIDFCDRLIKEKLDLIWNCPNGIRIDTLDDELLKKMKQAGCYAMSLPIEFGTQRMLDIVNKGTNLKKMLEIVPLVEKNGIKATCFFIIGHPEEKEADIKETIRLSKTLKISRAYFSIYKILPGSADYFKYGKEKKKIVFSEGNKQIKALQRYAILSFYLRPKQFLNAVQDNLSFSQIKESMNIFKRFVIK